MTRLFIAIVSPMLIASAGFAQSASVPAPAMQEGALDPAIDTVMAEYNAKLSSIGFRRILASRTENNPRGNFDVKAENELYAIGLCGQNCQSMTLNIYSKTFEKTVYPQNQDTELRRKYISFETTADARYAIGGTATCIVTTVSCAMKVMVFVKSVAKPDPDTEEKPSDDDGDRF